MLAGSFPLETVHHTCATLWASVSITGIHMKHEETEPERDDSSWLGDRGTDGSRRVGGFLKGQRAKWRSSFPFRELIEAEPPEVGGRVIISKKAREATKGWGQWQRDDSSESWVQQSQEPELRARAKAKARAKSRELESQTTRDKYGILSPLVHL